MVGNRIGGLKAAATNKAKYGNDFYKIQGAKGGKLGHTGGFAANPELARIAGKKGGTISKRGPAKKINIQHNTGRVQEVKVNIRKVY